MTNFIVLSPPYIPTGRSLFNKRHTHSLLKPTLLVPNPPRAKNTRPEPTRSPAKPNQIPNSTPIKTTINNTTSKKSTLSTIKVPVQHIPVPPTFQEKIANQKRLIAAMSTAKSILSKYKNSTANSDQSWLISTIVEICNTPTPPMACNGFRFECTRAAAKSNAKLLQKYNYNLESFYAHHRGSIVSPGAEFRDAFLLDKLFSRHENWPILRDVLTQGVDYPFHTEFGDAQLAQELEIMLSRGNHKSSEVPLHKKKLLDGYIKETNLGWQVPLSLECLRKIKGAMIIPLGVPKQLTVNDDGEYADKFKITHDCSFEYSDGSSLNNSVDFEALPPCEYGMTLRRFLHMLHRARLEWPEQTIFIVKTDLDAAYRRIHVSPRIAVKQLSIVDNIAYLSYRLPFGSSPAPSLFSVFSDCCFDLAKDLPDDDTWDVTTVHSPNQPHLPMSIRLDPSIPFHRAKPLLVPVPLRKSFIEGYIDDGIGAGVDIDNTVDKLQNFEG